MKCLLAHPMVPSMQSGIRKKPDEPDPYLDCSAKLLESSSRLHVAMNARPYAEVPELRQTMQSQIHLHLQLA